MRRDERKLVQFVSCIFSTLFSMSVFGGDVIYERIDGLAVWKLQDGQTWEFEEKYNAGTKTERTSGAYESTGCQTVGEKDSPQGNLIVYKSDGRSCCMVFKPIGSKYLLNYVVGNYTFGVCSGGVYQLKTYFSR